MLHNYLAFKLKNGFLLRLMTLLFPVRVKGGEEGEGRGETMGQGKGEAEEKNIKNERRGLDKKKMPGHFNISEHKSVGESDVMNIYDLRSKQHVKTIFRQTCELLSRCHQN